MTAFDKVMEFVLSWEGGLVDHPEDDGQVTNYGISQAAHPDVDVRNLTVDQAKAIYRQEYWEPIQGDSLEYPEALALMDFAVNSGTDTALWYWEQAEDVWELQTFRAEYLTSLSDFPYFGRGWMRRVQAVNQKLEESVVPTAVERIQIYAGDRMVEVEPTKVSVGRSRSGGRKIMARID